MDAKQREFLMVSEIVGQEHDKAAGFRLSTVFYSVFVFAVSAALLSLPAAAVAVRIQTGAWPRAWAGAVQHQAEVFLWAVAAVVLFLLLVAVLAAIGWGLWRLLVCYIRFYDDRPPNHGRF